MDDLFPDRRIELEGVVGSTPGPLKSFAGVHIANFEFTFVGRVVGNMGRVLCSTNLSNAKNNIKLYIYLLMVQLKR